MLTLKARKHGVIGEGRDQCDAADLRLWRNEACGTFPGSVCGDLEHFLAPFPLSLISALLLWRFLFSGFHSLLLGLLPLLWNFLTEVVLRCLVLCPGDGDRLSLYPHWLGEHSFRSVSRNVSKVLSLGCPVGQVQPPFGIYGWDRGESWSHLLPWRSIEWGHLSHACNSRWTWMLGKVLEGQMPCEPGCGQPGERSLILSLNVPIWRGACGAKLFHVLVSPFPSP